jgi:AcrR family transcriptional regulator
MGRPARISRDQILSAAREAFSSKGFDGATLADIAGELGVTPAAVLRHFRSKQALFFAAMRGSVPPFIAELEGVDAAKNDPRSVPRRLAERFVPFAEQRVAENIVVYMHRRSRSFVVPFDADAADSPPRRGIAIVADYFARAAAAGRVRIHDPRSAALLFMGSLHSYVTLHQIFNLIPKYPLPEFIDALIELWTRGAIRGSADAAQESRPEASPDRGRARRTRDRDVRLLPERPKAEGDRPVGIARSADGRRRLPGRRTRRPRPDR